jgi:SRSO17 transposase
MDLDDETGTEYTSDRASVLGHADRVRPSAACANVCCHPSRVASRSRRGSSTTPFPKKGSHSVSVARQYCGQLGKQDNCQVTVSLSVATHQGSLPVAYWLYLPDDAGRRSIAGVPDDVHFQTKPESALEQLRQVLADGVPPAPVLMDPAYGNDSKPGAGISGLGLTYVAGILPTTMVWRPGEAPLPPASRAGRSRPGKRLRRHATHRPVAAKTLALELAADAWQQIKWRDGSNTPLSSRFARWRVRPAHDDARRSEPALLMEWAAVAAEPDHCWPAQLAWLPSSRNSLRRSLRIPDLREGDDSPFRTGPPLARHAIFPSRW